VWVSDFDSRRGFGLTFSAREEIWARKKYSALSAPSSFLPEAPASGDKDLELPDNLSPRIKELARGLCAGMDERGRIDSLLRFLKFGDFRYSLKNLSSGDNALEDFLFSSKRGNCEYFASALAVMLRGTGIPARLVAGYKGGYYNETGAYYMVLESNAHVWVEVYVAGKGWLRLDPTPPYPAATLGASTVARLALKIRVLADTFTYYWNKAIIEYDLNRQIALWNTVSRNLARTAPRLDMSRRKALARISSLPLSAALLYGALLLWRRRRRKTNRLIARFEATLARRGYKRRRNEGLEEYASAIPDEKLRAGAMRFVLHFEEIYYRDAAFTKEDAARLKKLIGEMDHAPSEDPDRA
jgi:hypothetical protein